MTPLLILLVLLLLGASAYLSAAEAALLSVGRSRLRTVVEEGFQGADRLLAAREQAAEIQASVRLASTILDLSAAGVMIGVAVVHRGAVGGVLAAIVAVALIVIFTQVVARNVGIRKSIRLALVSAPTLLRVKHWASPVVASVVRTESFLRRENGDEEPTSDERQVLELTSLGREEGVVEEEEHLLVERAFRLDELAAWDVMTPRVDVFAWREELTLEEVIEEMRNVPYSRVPIFRETVDEITGIVHIREAYEAYVAGRREERLSQLAREPFFIPGSLPLTRLLRDFQARRIHMGVVADEFGGTDGIVTLEDVLEELVGEIEDELDTHEDSLVSISKNEIVVNGGIELREINYSFNVSLPHMEHRSLNGFILEELGRVPVTGEAIELPGLRIEVLDATETQVLRARLRKVHPVVDGETERTGGQATGEEEGAGPEAGKGPAERRRTEEGVLRRKR